MKTFAKRVLFALTPVLLLVLIGEAAARVRLYLQHNKDTFYLFMPLSGGNHTAPAPVESKFHVVRYGGGPDSDTYYYKGAPGTYEVPAPYSTRYRINSLGFRGRDFDPATKTAGVMRIFCLGESSTFGEESNDDQTWPARLAYYLEKQKPGAHEVINAGFGGYYSLNIRNLVLEELDRYQPDMLIVYAGVNDLNFERNQEKVKGRSLAVAVHGFLYYRWSMLYTLLVEKASVMTQGNPVPMVDQVDRSKEHFVDNMTAVLQWCQSHGVKCVVVRQMVHSVPSVLLKDSLSLQEAQDSLRNGTIDAMGGRYAPALTLSRHVELMNLFKTLCAAHGVPFLDVRPAMAEALEKGDKLMYDYVHLTAAANDIIAREIARRLNFPRANNE